MICDLKIATWNIHMGIGLDQQRDLARTAEVILQMEPELIGLQEVDNHVKTSGSDLETLGQLTGLEVVAGPTMERSEGDYGNALLTRLPILKVERHALSVKDQEPRGLLIVTLEARGVPLRTAVTHLGLRPGERRFQVRKLIEHLSPAERAPLILMGDFNEWLFWGRPLRWLHQHFDPVRSPATFPSRCPLLRLDHILSTQRGQLHSVMVYKTPLTRIASDHLPLTACYCLEQTPERQED